MERALMQSFYRYLKEVPVKANFQKGGKRLQGKKQQNILNKVP